MPVTFTLGVTMSTFIDHGARKHLAALARRLAAGAITNEQFESECPDSKESAVHDICFYGLWPLYDDFIEHKLVGKWALTREGRTFGLPVSFYFFTLLPYRYPRVTGFAQVPVILLQLLAGLAASGVVAYGVAVTNRSGSVLLPERI